jgi:hypothetical protein
MSRKGLVVLGTLLSFGCASSYTPRPSPYLAPVELAGCSGYMRDGQCFAPGFWGGGGLSLVKGVPAAEARMQPYRSERTATNLFALLSLATVSAANVAALAALLGDQSQSGKWVIAGFVLVDVAIVSAIFAAHYGRKSHRTRLESVNLYNQAVEDQRRCPTPAGEPGAATQP